MKARHRTKHRKTIRSHDVVAMATWMMMMMKSDEG